MDHYKVLGLHRTATKEEIKAAFKKLAFQYHPDKHSLSPKVVRDNATLRFKRVSEAYEVLMDDRKRADYNMRWCAGAGGGGRRSGFSAGGNNYCSQYRYSYGSNGNTYEARYSSGNVGGFASKLELALRFLTTRSSLVNLGFAAAILSGIIVIDTSREAIWKMQNSGKSFEEAMKSIEKAKAYMEKRT